MSVEEMLKKQALIDHAANLRDTNSATDAALAKDLRKASKHIGKKVDEKRKVENEKHFFYHTNSQKTSGINGLLTKYSADKTLPQHKEWIDTKAEINIRVSWDSSLTEEIKEHLTPNKMESIDAISPKAEQMPIQPSLRIIESNRGILKHSYTPKK